MSSSRIALLTCVTALTFPLLSIAQDVDVATLRIKPTGNANPQVAYTNKRSAFFQTQTRFNDHPEHAWFRGLNIAGRRIFQDITVELDGRRLDPGKAMSTVMPNELKRVYPSGTIELVRMFDHQDVVSLEYPNRLTRPSVTLTGDGLKRLTPQLYAAGEGENRLYVAIATYPGRAFIAVAPSSLAAQELAFRASLLADGWTLARNQRMNALISGDHFLGADSQTSALRWLTLSLDSLLTRQRGTGIYAGLPWFQEYWGRDQFIALPGATLVNGQFESAKHILTSFARFQDTDPKSPFYGRLPNIVKPDALDYHTTDGTPRFVIALRDYVDYSGDVALARELYPVVKASIEGSIRNFTDAAGYLTHADNETWMDARREPDKVSYSPRGNRANDIQALWIAQLKAGAIFAKLVGDDKSQREWAMLAAQVQTHFVNDFVGDGKLADHLNPDGSPDFRIRPNGFFALDLLPDHLRDGELKRLSKALIRPWGVATLDRKDTDFLPYHLAPGQWHKDAAYHNGTVWPWLDGIAMQRLIESGRTTQAWQLFKFNNKLALGTNGSLPETMDALPHPGENLPRLTGTHSQAWSLAEQLRIWYQGFVGIQPHLTEGLVVLAPRLMERQNIRINARIGAGWIRVHATPTQLTYRFDNLATLVHVDLPMFEAERVTVRPGDQLNIGSHTVQLLRNGQLIDTVTLKPRRN